MTYYVNKIVFGLLNPMSVALLLALAALATAVFAPAKLRRRLALVLGAAAFLWLLVWSNPALMPDFGRRLESEFPPAAVETLPQADLIVLLGGGMSKGDGGTVYPEMHESADRVWHAARLWKAGKAPLIFTTGANEAHSSAVLLKDLGVPASALRIDSLSRNTEDNARAAAKEASGRADGRRPRVLLVTSAWHMRRSLLMFAKYAPGVDVVPAACDYEALNFKSKLRFDSFISSVDCMAQRSRIFKEILGYWGYRWLRK